MVVGVPPAAVLPLPTLEHGLPAAPPPELDPYLDAAARCMARHGIGRTSVQDVARELNINRATVYRNVGSVDDMVRLLVARELRTMLSVVRDLELNARVDGPKVIVQLVAAVVRYTRNHPVVAKVLSDEPELIGPFLITYLPDVVRRVAEVVTPVIEWAQRTGTLAKRDPGIMAEWLVRTAASLILDPLPDDTLEAFLCELLLPALKK
jgi:AcrR family transcriptional regulator